MLFDVVLDIVIIEDSVTTLNPREVSIRWSGPAFKDSVADIRICSQVNERRGTIRQSN